MRTRVVNMFTDEYDVYVGRPGFGTAGPFGNLHPVGRPCRLCNGRVHTPAESLSCFTRDFRAHLLRDPAFRNDVRALRGLRLGCYCDGTHCHARVIAAWADGEASIEEDTADGF